VYEWSNEGLISSLNPLKGKSSRRIPRNQVKIEQKEKMFIYLGISRSPKIKKTAYKILVFASGFFEQKFIL